MVRYLYHRQSFPRNRDSRQQNIPNLFNKGYGFYIRTRNVHNARWPRDKWGLLSYSDWLDKARDYARARRARYLTVGEKRVKKNRKSAEIRLNKRFEDYMLHRHGAWPTYKNQIYEKLHLKRNHQFVNPPYYPDIKKEKEDWLTERMYRAYDRAKQKTNKK